MPIKISEMVEPYERVLQMDPLELSRFVLLDVAQLDRNADRAQFHRRTYCTAAAEKYRTRNHDNPRRSYSYPKENEVAQKFSLAWEYLNGMHLIARDIQQSDNDCIIVTDAGYEVARNDEINTAVLRSKFPMASLHPSIVKASQSGFLRGEFSEAVVLAARAVEDLVRRKTKNKSTRSSADLVRNALKAGGALSDKDEEKSEQDGLADIAVGFFKRSRNRFVHQVGSLEMEEAIEVLHIASYLIRTIEPREVSNNTD